MTPLVLFNTAGRRLEPFTPLHAGEARLYSCGPTVYNHVHIGNLRTFVASDLLRRTLSYFGYRVTQVMNITDVDDKILAGAAAAGKPLAEYTAPFVDSFFEALDRLQVERAERYPRATEHIPEMLALIGRLMERGYAYVAEGSVFFRIGRDEDYGRLSGKDLSQMRRGERVLADEYDKEDLRDFVLWKAAKPGEPSWDSPWGPGRPGWHIECSAMSMHYLGETFDLHTGGVDLVFPHHENEVAQSESATGVPFSRGWFHSEHLIVDGQKMSKSLGNQYTLGDLLDRGVAPRALRYLFLSVHYRQKLNFTFESLEASERALERVDEMRFRVEHAAEEGAADERVGTLTTVLEGGFRGALAEDLNISGALAAVFDFVRGVNRRLEDGPLGGGDRERILIALAGVDRVLGVLDPARWRQGAPDPEAEEIDRLVADREAARKGRDFATADRIRQELTERGITVEDTVHGPRWKRT
jgi:cysteinyl-tRNA synthetase